MGARCERRARRGARERVPARGRRTSARPEHRGIGGEPERRRQPRVGRRPALREGGGRSRRLGGGAAHALVRDRALDVDPLAAQLVRKRRGAELLGRARRLVGDEAKAARLARARVDHDDAVDDVAPVPKVVAELRLGRLVREPADEDLARAVLDARGGRRRRRLQLIGARHGHLGLDLLAVDRVLEADDALADGRVRVRDEAEAARRLRHAVAHHHAVGDLAVLTEVGGQRLCARKRDSRGADAAGEVLACPARAGRCARGNGAPVVESFGSPPMKIFLRGAVGRGSVAARERVCAACGAWVARPSGFSSHPSSATCIPHDTLGLALKS